MNKEKNWIRIGKRTALAAGIFLAAGIGLHAVSNVGREADRAALLTIKDAYQEAINTGNTAKLAPHLDADFTYTTITGLEIKSAQEFTDGLAAVQSFLGAGGKYTVTVLPAMGKTSFWRQMAFARGTTTDKVTVDSGGQKKDYDFGSLWFAVMSKDSGSWKLVHAYAMFTSNPFSQQQLDRFNAALSSGTKKAPKGPTKGG